MDLNNVSDLINGMKEFYDTHDIRKTDIFGYDSFELGRKADPKIKELVSKDKYGEYIGFCTRSWIDSDRDNQGGGITFYLRPDGRPAGVWKPNMIGDLYEIFDYQDGYYTSAMYTIMGFMENKSNFIYYVLGDDGKVSEMIQIYGGMIIINSKTINITRMKFEYDGDTTILKSNITYIYKKTADGYEFVEQESGNGDQERVIDDQSELGEELRARITDGMSLEEIVRTFFDVVKNAPENPEEDIQFVAGTNPYFNPFRTENCTLEIVRSTPTEGDEFYQLDMTVRFESEDEEIPYDTNYNTEGNDALLEFILGCASFNALKDKKIRGVDIEVYET